MRPEEGTVMERNPAKTFPDLQTYSIFFFADGHVEIAVTGTHRDGQPIILHAEEDCAIHFRKPVFEHDIYWLPKQRNVEVLPLHDSSAFDILRPVKPVAMIVNGEPVDMKDGPRIPTSG